MRLVADRKERLDHFLARSLPDHSRSKLANIARENGVLVNGTPRRASYGLNKGDVIDLQPPRNSAPHDLTPAEIPLDVRFEDEYLLVVNKPRGLAVHPAASLKSPSLVNALLAREHQLSTAGGAFRPGIVHRLDKDTTGLLVVAKTDSVHRKLAKQIEEKNAVRRYFAVVAGYVEHERFTVSAPLARSKRNRLLMAVDLNGRQATTHVKRVASTSGGTLLAVSLDTGRTHQIRIHLESIGHPVLGDPLYAPKEYHTCPLQLHAAFLSLIHPVTNESLTIFAAPPADFIEWRQAVREQIEPF